MCAPKNIGRVTMNFGFLVLWRIVFIAASIAPAPPIPAKSKRHLSLIRRLPFFAADLSYTVKTVDIIEIMRI